jgi:hypothetical protein
VGILNSAHYGIRPGMYEHNNYLYFNHIFYGKSRYYSAKGLDTISSLTGGADMIYYTDFMDRQPFNANNPIIHDDPEDTSNIEEASSDGYNQQRPIIPDKGNPFALGAFQNSKLSQADIDAFDLSQFCSNTPGICTNGAYRPKSWRSDDDNDYYQIWSVSPYRLYVLSI